METEKNDRKQAARDILLTGTVVVSSIVLLLFIALVGIITNVSAWMILLAIAAVGFLTYFAIDWFILSEITATLLNENKGLRDIATKQNEILSDLNHDISSNTEIMSNGFLKLCDMFKLAFNLRDDTENKEEKQEG